MHAKPVYIAAYGKMILGDGVKRPFVSNDFDEYYYVAGFVFFRITIYVGNIMPCEGCSYGTYGKS